MKVCAEVIVTSWNATATKLWITVGVPTAMDGSVKMWYRKKNAGEWGWYGDANSWARPSQNFRPEVLDELVAKHPVLGWIARAYGIEDREA